MGKKNNTIEQLEAQVPGKQEKDLTKEEKEQLNRLAEILAEAIMYTANAKVPEK